MWVATSIHVSSYVGHLSTCVGACITKQHGYDCNSIKNNSSITNSNYKMLQIKIWDGVVLS